ncbi:MAG: hypothetical protein EXS48_02370 [Candidatus Staskawiczbacteria bacterium]|nr:hypothetical protein [Candidatus Staskawiczbacteria bacterium]
MSKLALTKFPRGGNAMRLVFHLFSKERGRLVGRIFEVINFPSIATLQKRWKITFAIASKDPNDEGCVESGKVTLDVVDYEEHDDHDNAWVDAGELTNDLFEGRLKVTGWKEISSPKPD